MIYINKKGAINMKCSVCNKETDNNLKICQECLQKNSKKTRCILIILTSIFLLSAVIWNVPIFIISLIAIIGYCTILIKKAMPSAPKKYIVKTQIIGNSTSKSMSSSITRGVIGGTILGPVGMLGGALSGKNKQKTRFLIYYSDDTKETIEVPNDGIAYNNLIKYLE